MIGGKAALKGGVKAGINGGGGRGGDIEDGNAIEHLGIGKTLLREKKNEFKLVQA